MMTKWKWQAGKLTNKRGDTLSINEAYLLQNHDPDVAKACKGILRPCNRRTMWYIRTSARCLMTEAKEYERSMR